ncbi:DciA family protein [Candidatus Poriferisocius sp.]|uniref:DciA family protein n=1 Tax=Candidatus Poriferisocius sp. TaxID=3101276 RepID=UPI003B51B6CC
MGWEPLHEPSGPRRIGEALDQVAFRLKAPRAQVLATVFDAWEELVGEVLAAHASPLRLVERELVVAVDDPAWTAEMKFFSAELISRINAAAKEEVVTSLTVRVRSR